MVNNSEIDSDEINLIDLIYTLWEGKWKVAAAVVISFLAVIGYQSTKINKFTAITEIQPIGIVKLNKFSIFNNLITNSKTTNNTTPITLTDNTGNKITYLKNNEGISIAGKINKITSSRLLDLYLNILKNESVFENAIRKFNLLEASQYNNDQEYNEAVTRLASSIKILSPSIDDEKKRGNLETSYHTISFTYHDVEKWKNILIYVEKFANKLTKKTLINEYNNTLLFLKNERKHRLEDISIKINNILTDYDREISNQLAYLKEQSEIARKLGIAKNTIEVQTFGNQNALLSNVKTDSPFYLRGYEAIDKEIELIQSRKDKKAFIEGLFELEKKKRAIEQDQTIERLELSLQSNLLADDSSNFYAASINAVTTKFKYKDNNKMRVLAILIGLIAGIFYVLVSKAFQSIKSSKKTN